MKMQGKKPSLISSNLFALNVIIFLLKDILKKIFFLFDKYLNIGKIISEV